MAGKGTNHRIGRTQPERRTSSRTADVGPEVRPVPKGSLKPLPSRTDWRRYLEGVAS